MADNPNYTNAQPTFQAIANELQGTGVSVTVLCPGPTRTEFDTVTPNGWLRQREVKL